MSNTTDVSKLDDLIVTTIDSVKGYEASAELAEAGTYVSFFTEMAQERRQVVAALQQTSRALGGTPSDFGSAAATIHRRWEDLRHAFGGGDASVIKAVEAGEDYLKEEYERALNDENISAPTRAIIAQNFESVRKGHDRASALKHALTD